MKVKIKSVKFDEQRRHVVFFDTLRGERRTIFTSKMLDYFKISKPKIGESMNVLLFIKNSKEYKYKKIELYRVTKYYENGEV